jgi:hypothetical protein
LLILKNALLDEENINKEVIDDAKKEINRLKNKAYYSLSLYCQIRRAIFVRMIKIYEQIVKQ